MFLNSIRWRLLLWQGLVLTLVVAGFGVTAFQLESARRMRRIDNELQARSNLLTPLVPPPNQRGNPPPPRLPPRAAALFDEGQSNATYYVVWLADGTEQRRSASAPAGVPLPSRENNEWQSARTRGTFREFVRFTSLDRCVLTGTSIKADLAELARFRWLLSTVGAGVLLVGLSGGWWLTTRAMRPIDRISATAERIAEGDLSQRIDAANTRDELGRLVAVLNSTFARLEAAFAQQKHFTGDASHELRTPLAVIIAEAQTALTRERSAEEYRETIEICLETAQQMKALTESLLQLARFDAGQEPIQRDHFNLAATAKACVELVLPLAARRKIDIQCDLAPAHIDGDAVRLGQLVTNLLTNAIHYNRDKGQIHVTTSMNDGAAVLRLADTGKGIAPEDLPHIFERFYRCDKARSRAEGRSGLGLAICKRIVDAHHGSIEVSSQVGIGTTFTVRLPG